MLGDPPPPQHTSGPWHHGTWPHDQHPMPHLHRGPHPPGHHMGDPLLGDPLMDPTGAPLPGRDMGAYGGMINFLFPHNHRSMVGLEVRRGGAGDSWLQHMQEYMRLHAEARRAGTGMTRGASRSCIERNTFPHKFIKPAAPAPEDQEEEEEEADKCTICLSEFEVTIIIYFG